ncbi:MAG: hypothetical protein SF066_11360 [Thermoanaerobaculia bacterium]|nr:hypothetical protein [Thermoanaerobaculia bacterium]
MVSVRRCLSTLLLLLPAAAQAVDFDIVYVRQPRNGDSQSTIWPEVFHPARLEPGADLMLLHPNGSEEVLVAGGHGAVTDPYVSFDAEWVFYAYFPDVRPAALNSQRDDLPLAGADIYRIHLATRRVQRLTFGEFTPNLAAGTWDPARPVDAPPPFNRLGYGILNLGPCPLPGGKVAFVSNRNGFWPQKGFTSPTLQLFVMDEDGKNVTPIAPMTVSSALHPTILKDGRIAFSSHEDQGLRDTRLWGIWAIQPDGRGWSPLVSAFRTPQAFHFMTQRANEDLVVVDYYNLNNNGFGALYRFPIAPPAGEPAFHSAFPEDNPEIEQTIGAGFSYPFRMPFTPRGLVSLTPFTHGLDEAAPIGADGVTRVGKLTHPSAAPGDDLLVVWTPGPANDLDRPTPLPAYDGGIYVLPGTDPIASPAELILVKNSPGYNEAWPRAVVPYAAIFGVPEPARLPWLPNDGTLHTLLPAGTPFGLVGSSSLYKRESFPGFVVPWSNTFDGLDVWNTSENEQSSNWIWQGADAGKYSNADIWAVRILAMEANTHRSYGPNEGKQFVSHAGERLRILGEIPVRKAAVGGGPVIDPEGNPDTSFLVKLPADTPFTFQTLDRRGLVLNMSQTWHQLRPGELRTNCGGCHAHSQLPLAFSSTAAARPEYVVHDLAHTTPLLTRDGGGNPGLVIQPVAAVDVEFLRDIRPILARSCTGCHGGTAPAGNLKLDDHSLSNGLPGDYRRLADDTAAQWGHPPVIANGTWRQTNASRYVRMFQSRRSLLAWKVFGQRLDGWTNADHPTESVPGDAGTLPAGADPNAADLDYTGTLMPPPSSGYPALSEAEKMTIARWIDLGCPIDLGPHGWFRDDQRPALTVSFPRPGLAESPVTELRVGAADGYSGLAPGSLSIRADFPVAGRPAGSELADLFSSVADGVWSYPLPAPLGPLVHRTITARVADVQGNVTESAVTFSTLAPIFADGFEGGDDSRWSLRVP